MLNALLSGGLGLVLLYFGAEGLVRGGAALGLRFGLSPLVVGLTIVAFGTSAPELVVSLNAVAAGQTDIATGNVIGSNIANIGLILGLSALIAPIAVQVRVIRIDIPILIGVTVLFVLLMGLGGLTRLDGLLLLGGIAVFTIFNIRAARQSRSGARDPYAGEVPEIQHTLLRDVAMVAGGLAILILGGRLLVSGAVDLARLAGLSEAVIGLTIVAVGTSLPELTTSIVAAARNMGDISVGNIIGSNIFNILGILGASATLVPLPPGGVGRLDLGVMLLFAVAVLPLARTGFILKRWEGLLFLCGYGAYLAWLVVTAREPAAQMFTQVLP